MNLILKTISNSKAFADVKREIEIIGISINSDSQTLDIHYRIIHIKDGKDITALFNPQTPPWHINNNQQMMVRDESFKPIANNNFKEIKDAQGNILNEKER